MKRFLNAALVTTVTCGLSLITASCSDDKEPSEEEKQQQAEQQAETDLDQAAEFWNVVGQLTDDVMPDDWLHATYTPSIGEPDGDNATVRIVPTADAETAAERFAQLTGAKVNENTQDYTFQSDAVGTLKYHRTGGTSLATVDVDIKQMPGLTQIIYQTPEQAGSNGKFDGTAYYRFGDVVKKMNSDGAYDYWICVRPCFGLAGKGDSHWITVSKIPTANIKDITKIINKQKVIHHLPKSLTTKREHMQNLAEMLYAMTNPDKWASNLATNDGYKTLKYFHDFNYKQLFPYNEDVFFGTVASNWELKGLFKTLFGLDREQMKTELEATGLNLVYSSATMSGNKIVLPIATYYQTNLKTEVLSKSNSEWTTQFDIQQLMSNGYITYQDIAGHKLKGWLVRYATGATLCKGSVDRVVSDKYCKLTNCEDVFVFNRDVLKLDMTKRNLIDTEPVKLSSDQATWNLNEYDGLAFYEHGDVLVDNNGHHWIVINQAGNPDCMSDKGEKMPFSELICFEGFKFSADKKNVTNLPNREEAIRGAFWLDMFFTQTNGSPTLKDASKEAWIDKSKYAQWGSSCFNALEGANFNIRDYFQLIKAQTNNPRQSTHAASIAYNDGSGRLRLLRFIMNNQNTKEEFKYYLWDHYVSNPDATTQLYSEYAYSNIPIYLDDLTDQTLVNLYAEDTYARQGLQMHDVMTGDGSTDPRQPRSATEPRAADVSNLVYNINTWRSRSFVADMWNEPILMFRMTRIYDRGASEHAIKTVDGLTLTHIKHHEWPDPTGDDADFNREMFRSSTISIQFKQCITPGDFKLDGKNYTFPLWQTLYK